MKKIINSKCFDDEGIDIEIYDEYNSNFNNYEDDSDENEAIRYDY